MNLGKRNRFSANKITVQLLREGIVESIHSCQAAVVDTRGRILSAAGDPQTTTFARSSLKPIQALPVSITGAQERLTFQKPILRLFAARTKGRSLKPDKFLAFFGDVM